MIKGRPTRQRCIGDIEFTDGTIFVNLFYPRSQNGRGSSDRFLSPYGSPIATRGS